MAPADDDPGFRKIGCQIVCSRDIAAEITQRLREVVSEILGDAVFDYCVE
ncbi:hypothetical protein ACFWWT_39555 [Streptomyces sp. NPDC058676]